MNEIHLEIIDSTNSYAKEHASTFPPGEITCISAEEQTAGRGRHQRKWISPDQVNIYATFYFQLPRPTHHLSALAQVMAFSLATVLIKEGFQPKIKWPNDVQLNGKKLAGILCETTFQSHCIEIFLGIGININLSENQASLIDQPATSLLIETGKLWDKRTFFTKLQNQFIEDLNRFKRNGFAPFHNLVENLLAYKGEMIEVIDGPNKWRGICHSLTPEGKLNLYLDNQIVQTISSGDLFL